MTDVLMRVQMDVADIKKGVNEFKRETQKIKKQTDKIGSAIKGAFTVTAIVGAAKAVFNFSQQISEATQKVKSLANVSGRELDFVTGKILAVSQVFQQDFNSVLESANNLAKQMGISVGEATKLIEQGFAAGANSTGEFTAILKQYPAFFKEAGISAENFIAITSRQVKEGVFSDKGVDAIKEFSIRLREMTPAAQKALTAIGLSGIQIQQQLANGTITVAQVLEMVSGKLGELDENASTTGQVIADLFGGAGEDAGVKFLTSLTDINTEWERMEENMTEIGKAQLNLSQGTSRLNTIWSNFFGESSVGWTNFKSGIVDATTSLLVNLQTEINNIKRDFLNTWIAARVGFIGFVEIAKANLKILALRVKGLFTDTSEEIIKIQEDLGKKIADISKKANEEIAKNNDEALDKNVNLLLSLTGAGDGEKEIKKTATKTKQTFAKTFEEVDVGLDWDAILNPGLNEALDRAEQDATKTANAIFDINKQRLKELEKLKDEEFAKDQERRQLKIANTQTDLAIATGALNTLSTLQQIAMNKELAAAGNNEKKKEEIRKKFAKKEQTLAIGKGLVNTALGVTQALASLPPPASFIMAGIVAAKGLAEVATIKAQAFAAGGVPKKGLGLVGERGPELINFGSTARVQNDAETKKLLGFNGMDNIHVTIESELRGETIFQTVKEVERRRGRNL